MATSIVKVAILLADYGNDPTETAIPYAAFKSAGYEVSFVTEKGAKPACDTKMLTGWTQKLLGADQRAVSTYNSMCLDDEWNHPLSWTDSDFTLTSFDIVYIPGGHDKGVRQLLDSTRIQSLLVEYFPLTKKPSNKICAALCHGVQLLAHSRYPDTRKSVLHDVVTTTLPDFFENSVYSATSWVLGDYYKTYGKGTDNVAKVVRDSLDSGVQFKTSSNPLTPFVVVDEKYNYLSARWPGDAELLAKRVIETVQGS